MHEMATHSEWRKRDCHENLIYVKIWKIHVCYTGNMQTDVNSVVCKASNPLTPDMRIAGISRLKILSLSQ